MQFTTETDQEISMQVSSGDRRIATARSLKFLGLTINTSLTWSHHIIELITRLNKACCTISSIKLFMSIDVLRSTYFSYVHSITVYLMELYFGATLPIVKTYSQFRKEYLD
jgi:3-methyladenine DNA glycosylase AlkC